MPLGPTQPLRDAAQYQYRHFPAILVRPKPFVPERRPTVDLVLALRITGAAMAFGFRVSHHASQTAATRTGQEHRPPVCPCARCFNRGSGGQDEFRAACGSPAREVRVPCGHPASLSGFVLEVKNRARLGLKRTRSVASMASDLRPLRKGAEDVAVGDGDGQHRPLEEESV